MSRPFERHTTGCPISSFTNTRNIRNILIGSVLEDEQSEETVILHDGRKMSGEGLGIDAWKSNL